MKRYEMKEYNKSLLSLKKTEEKKDALLNELVRNALYHSVLNNQKTPAVNLINALGKATRRKDIINYMTKYGNMVWSEGEENKEKGLQAKLKTDTDIKECWKDEEKSWAYVEGLPNFWDDQPEADPNYDFDLDAYLIAVRKTISRKVKRAAENHGNVTGKEKIEGFNKALESIGITV